MHSPLYHIHLSFFLNLSKMHLLLIYKVIPHQMFKTQMLHRKFKLKKEASYVDFITFENIFLKSILSPRLSGIHTQNRFCRLTGGRWGWKQEGTGRKLGRKEMEGESTGRDDVNWGPLGNDVETQCRKNTLESISVTLAKCPSNESYGAQIGHLL